MSKHIKYTVEMVQEAVDKSTNWRQVCEILGLSSLSGSQHHIKVRAEKYGVNYGHFVGQGHNKNKFWIRTTVDDYLKGKVKVTSHKLRLKLIESGVKDHKCEKCQLSSWLGQPIALELHHKNSDNEDNSLENLQILCPNCHNMEPKKYKSRSGAE